jgi:hypothetical protein
VITTEEAAYDDIRATFKARWDFATTAIVGYVPPILYAGVVQAQPSANQCWCRISTQTVLTEQAALSDSAGKRRDETSGIVIVQMFIPLASPDGDLLARRLATTAKKAFLRRSQSGTIWFRRARVVELEPDGTSHRRNVVAEFEYDELN